MRQTTSTSRHTIALLCLPACAGIFSAAMAKAQPAAPTPASPTTPPVQESYLVLDGDVLRAPNGTVIRLWALDAPEFKAADGPAARATLDDLIAGQIISCTDTGERSNGHVVARCMAGGKDLAEAMLRQGQAYTYRSFLDDSPQAKVYLAAEAEARRTKRGLWAETVYTPSAWEMVPYAWQSLIGGLLAAFAAIAAVWETRRAARKTIAAVDQQVAHEKQIYADTIKRAEVTAASTKWVGLVGLQIELEACLQSIKAVKADLDGWSGRIIKSTDPFVALYVPREFNSNLTGLSDLGALFGKNGFRKLRDFRKALATLTHPEVNKPIDSGPVLGPFTTRADVHHQIEYGYGMSWRNGALDRLIAAIAAGDKLAVKLADLITSLETDGGEPDHAAAPASNNPA